MVERKVSSDTFFEEDIRNTVPDKEILKEYPKLKKSKDKVDEYVYDGYFKIMRVITCSNDINNKYTQNPWVAINENEELISSGTTLKECVDNLVLKLNNAINGYDGGVCG